MVTAVAAGLSTLLANDVVCLAVTPIIVEACLRRGLKPLPFLLALACASNIGSAATLIGNSQNMLIGQKLQLSFVEYLLDGVVPAVAGCVLAWRVICRQTASDWHCPVRELSVRAPEFNRWQTGKGIAVIAGMVAAFVTTDWPREVVASGVAGLLLLSRRMHSRRMLALVDWHLLVLFAGLFVVNHALAASGWLTRSMSALGETGVRLSEPAWLFGITVVLSNLVSNVPAVMLLLPAGTHAQAGAILALASTLAGNFFIVGSIANIIVVEQADQLGVRISWRDIMSASGRP